MATQDVTLTSAWQLIATAGDEFLLTLPPGGHRQVAVALSDTEQDPTVAGHRLLSQGEGLNRTLIGPGYVYARSRSGVAVAAVLSAWTPS